MNKKILLILTLLTVHNTLFSQSVKWEELKQLNPIIKSLQLNEDSKQSIINYANSTFQPSVVVNQQWQQGNWVDISKWEYPAYNNEGRATEYVSYSFIEGAFVPAAKEFYEYSNGVLITTTQRYNEGTWVNYNRLTYSNFFGEDYDYLSMYDILIEYWENSQWTPSSRTIISYNQDGLPQSSSSERFEEGTWNPSGQAFYTHNSQDQLIEEISQYYREGEFINSGKSEYSYEPNGLADVNTFYYWGEDEWLQSSRNDYDYNADDMISEIHNFAPQEGTWWENSRYIYSYQNGIFTGYYYDIVNEGEWIDYSRLVNSFDENNNVTEALSQNYSQNFWVNARRLIYEYVEVTSVDEDNRSIPNNYSLSQNYPNPFNPSTRINFSIPKTGHVSLRVFDSLGREVAELVNDKLTAGSYSVNFSTESTYQTLSSGIYFYRFESNNFQQTKKLILIK